MAEKVVSVRLQALIDSYKRNMQEAGKATEQVAKADRWKDLGQKTAALGDSLTQRLTLPIVGVGVAAVKMSMDVDSVFTDMQSLAGATAAEVESMRGEVLDLAGETGKAPKELAEALYFLKSSGLDASQAMEALEVSAKASAAGMGNTVQIADAVSSAMNAYAASGMTAARATDVLVATAREGKAEPAELAAQMGRLLPLSSELGISFEHVGAALASLSLTGNDAAQASTLLSNIMSKMLRPSQQAAEMMQSVGISVDDIRKMIDEKGLLGALETLRVSLGDAGFNKFLEDAQATVGGLALTGETLEKNREIFDKLTNSVGATDEAFETWGKSMGAQNAKAWGELQATMVRLGDTLAPLAADMIGFASDVLEWFTKLPGPAKTALGIFVALLATMGPLLSVFGRITSLVSGGMKLGTAFLDWASGMNAFGQAMNGATKSSSGLTSSLGRMKGAAGLAGVAIAVAGAGLALKSWADDRKRREIEQITEAFGKMTDVTSDAAVESFRMTEAFGRTDKVFQGLLETNTEAASRFVDLAENAGLSRDRVAELRSEIEAKIEADAQAQVDSEKHSEAVQEAAGAFDEETTAISAATEALGAFSAAMKAQFDPLFGVMNAANGVRDARLAVEEATTKLSEAEKEYGKDSAEAAAATRDLEDAHGSAVEAAFAFEQAQIELASAVENQDIKLEDAIAMLQRWVEQGHITQAEADITADKFRFSAGAVQGYSDAIKRVPGSTRTDIHVNTLAAREGISTVHGDLNRLDGRTATVYVTIHGKTSGELLSGYGVKPPGRAMGGPVYRGLGYMVGERGPEWFEPDMSGRIIPNHMLSSHLVPQSAYAGGGGAVVNVALDMRGAVIASQRQWDGMVADGLNRALRTMPGRVNIVPSAVRR